MPDVVITLIKLSRGNSETLSSSFECQRTDWKLGHVQAHTGAQRFATASGFNDMFPGNGVQRGLRYVFSCLVGVKNVSPISSDEYINLALLKRPLAQWVQVKSCDMCPLQLGIHNN